MKNSILVLLLLMASCHSSIELEEPFEQPGDILSIYVAKYKNDKVCAISYTFDDGICEHYTLVFPELEKNNLKATFFVCGDFIENDSGSGLWLTWPQVKEMSEKGHEISNHTWSHLKLTEIDLEEVLEQIQKNDQILLEQTGKIPLTFCYPWNTYNDEVLELATKNRVLSGTKYFQMGQGSTPESLERWINGLLDSGEWGVGMLHAVIDGHDALTSPSILWDHLAKVKELENEIWIDTFCEVGRYTQAWEDISLEIQEKENKVIVIPHINLNKKLFATSLTMVFEKSHINTINVQQGNTKIPTQIKNNKIIFDFDPYGPPITIKFHHVPNKDI